MEIPFQKPASTGRSTRYWISSCLCSEQSWEKLKLFFWEGGVIVQWVFWLFWCQFFTYSVGLSKFNCLFQNLQEYRAPDTLLAVNAVSAYICMDRNLELKVPAKLLYHWIYLISHYKWRVILPLKIMLLAVFFGMKLNPICEGSLKGLMKWKQSCQVCCACCDPSVPVNPNTPGTWLWCRVFGLPKEMTCTLIARSILSCCRDLLLMQCWHRVVTITCSAVASHAPSPTDTATCPWGDIACILLVTLPLRSLLCHHCSSQTVSWKLCF